MKSSLQTPVINFYSDTVPEYVFESVRGCHGVNVYWKKEYEIGEKLLVDYFSFDFETNKVASKRVEKIIEDHIKEVYLNE